MQPGNPFILCPCRGKKRKIGQSFPPLCPDFVCFLALLFFGWFFFFSKMQVVLISPPDNEAFALSASSPCLSALARLSPFLSLSHPLCLSGRQTATQTAQDGTFVRMWRHSHTQADTLIEMSYLLSRQDYMHIAILFREQDDTQLQTRWWLHTEIQCTEYTSSFNTAECVT